MIGRDEPSKRRLDGESDGKAGGHHIAGQCDEHDEQELSTGLALGAGTGPERCSWHSGDECDKNVL